MTVPSYNGGGSDNISGSGQTLTVTYTTTAGRTGVIVFSSRFSGQTVVNITDTGGSRYRRRAVIDNGTIVQEIWATEPGELKASTSTTVFLSVAATGRKSAILGEFSGVVAIGSTNTNSGTGTSPTISLTTQDASNMVVSGMFGQYDPSITATTGTVRTTVNAGTDHSAVLMTNTGASEGVVTCAGTQADSGGWVATAMELRSDRQAGRVDSLIQTVKRILRIGSAIQWILNTTNVTANRVVDVPNVSGMMVVSPHPAGIVSTSPREGIGYADGAGSSVTQTSSRTTGVTINAVCGSITTNTTSLAAATAARFTVTNSMVRIGDVVVVCKRSGATNDRTAVLVTNVTNGSFDIAVSNEHTAAETGAIIINFAIIRAVTS